MTTRSVAFASGQVPAATPTLVFTAPAGSVTLIKQVLVYDTAVPSSGNPPLLSLRTPESGGDIGIPASGYFTDSSLTGPAQYNQFTIMNPGDELWITHPNACTYQISGAALPLP